MSITLPLKEMTVVDKIGLMEEIWTDLASQKAQYTLPDWHESILRERIRQADACEVGYTDWETAKQEINEEKSTDAIE